MLCLANVLCEAPRSLLLHNHNNRINLVSWIFAINSILDYENFLNYICCNCVKSFAEMNEIHSSILMYVSYYFLFITAVIQYFFLLHISCLQKKDRDIYYFYPAIFRELRVIYLTPFFLPFQSHFSKIFSWEWIIQNHSVKLAIKKTLKLKNKFVSAN